MNPYSTKGLDDMALSSVVSRLLEQALKEKAEEIGKQVAEKAAAEMRQQLQAQATEIAFAVRSKIKVAAMQSLDPRSIKVEIILQLPT